MQLSPTLTEKLYSAFPHLYRGRHKSQAESSMCWGFECGDGWFQLLLDLSQQLTDYMAQHPQVDIEVMQVKSKLGDLRYYVNGGDATTEKLIRQACEQSLSICEYTGKPGQLCQSDGTQRINRFKVMVLCPEKAKELGFAPIPQKK